MEPEPCTYLACQFVEGVADEAVASIDVHFLADGVIFEQFDRRVDQEGDPGVGEVEVDGLLRCDGGATGRAGRGVQLASEKALQGLASIDLLHAGDGDGCPAGWAVGVVHIRGVGNTRKKDHVWGSGADSALPIVRCKGEFPTGIIGS